MSFAYPWVLLTLVLLPLWLWFEWRRKKAAIGIPSLSGIDKVSREFRVWQHYLPWVLRAMVLLALILATARPQFGFTQINRQAEGLDIMLVIDVSGSMRAMDFEIDGVRQDRLFVVKEVIREFIETRPDDRIGLVVFGTEAFTQAPLTHDHAALLRFLDQVEIGLAGEQTAIGDGLAVATQRLNEIEAKSKLILLMTDGENNSGSIEPMAAAEAARSLGMRIYTVGVGSNEPVPFPRETWMGTIYERRIFRLDEQLLTEMAEMTGGRYFLASDTEQLQDIYRTVGELETRAAEIEEYYRFHDVGQWFVASAISLLLVELLLQLSPWRQIP